MPRTRVVDTDQIEGTCEQCKRPVVRCLWNGVDGWICAACGFFWSRESQHAQIAAGDTQEDEE